MAKNELIDDHVSLQQCKRALDALLTHEKKREEVHQETELLPGKEPNIWLNVTVKKIPTIHKVKPAKIRIAHPLIDPRTTAICLITKDPQRQYKDLLEKQGIKFISRVVGLEKLKGKFKPFEARRMLLKENGLFMADERIIPLLPKLLGVKWFEAKKQPIPVNLTKKDLKGELERTVSSTYMNQNKGTCTAIKVGILSQTPSQILDNIKMALPAILKRIEDGWDNIQSLHIKTNSSVSLPIWSCELGTEKGGRWDGFEAQSEGGSDESEDEESEDEAMQVEQAKPSSTNSLPTKGKKRAPDTQDDDVNAEKPKKKTKGESGKAAVAHPPAASPTTTTTTPSAPSKSHKRKTAAPSDAVPPKAFTTKAPVTPTIPTKSLDSVSASAEKAKKKSKNFPVPAPSSQILSTPIIESPPKGNKKTVATAQPAAPIETLAPAPEPSAAPDSAEHKQVVKKKTKQSKVPAENTDPTPSKELSSKGKTKQPKSPKSTAPDPPKASITQDELKQKRNTSTGEKKKDKIIKAKGGKSVKDKIIGKKPARN